MPQTYVPNLALSWGTLAGLALLVELTVSPHTNSSRVCRALASYRSQSFSRVGLPEGLAGWGSCRWVAAGMEAPGVSAGGATGVGN